MCIYYTFVGNKYSKCVYHSISETISFLTGLAKPLYNTNPAILEA